MWLSDLLVPILVLSLIVGAQPAYAADQDDEIVVNVGIDIEGLINAVTQSSQSLGNRLSATAGEVSGNVGTAISQVPDRMFEKLKGSAKDSVRSFNHPLLGLTAFLISANPGADNMFPLWEKIIPVLSALYLLVFMVSAMVFFLSALG